MNLNDVWRWHRQRQATFAVQPNAIPKTFGGKCNHGMRPLHKRSSLVRIHSMPSWCVRSCVCAPRFVCYWLFSGVPLVGRKFCTSLNWNKCFQCLAQQPQIIYIALVAFGVFICHFHFGLSSGFPSFFHSEWTKNLRICRMTSTAVGPLEFEVCGTQLAAFSHTRSREQQPKIRRWPRPIFSLFSFGYYFHIWCNGCGFNWSVGCHSHLCDERERTMTVSWLFFSFCFLRRWVKNNALIWQQISKRQNRFVQQRPCLLTINERMSTLFFSIFNWFDAKI